MLPGQRFALDPWQLTCACTSTPELADMRLGTVAEVRPAGEWAREKTFTALLPYEPA
jgi:hypothetical protein